MDAVKGGIRSYIHQAGKTNMLLANRGAVRCCQTSGRSSRSRRSRPRCASCRAFLLPRSCGGTSAACAAPGTVCPARRCSGWSSAWLGACPCCGGGDTQNTCREKQAHVQEHMQLSHQPPCTRGLTHTGKPLHTSTSIMLSCRPSLHAPNSSPPHHPHHLKSRPSASPTPTEQIETSRFPLSCNSTSLTSCTRISCVIYPPFACLAGRLEIFHPHGLGVKLIHAGAGS